MIKLSPWNRFLLEKLIIRSAIQEMPRLLWNRKVHYRIRNSTPPVSILRQLNPIHTPKPHFPKFHFNITLPHTPRPSVWALRFRLSNQNSVRLSHLPHARYVPSPSHSPSFHHPNINWWRLQVVELFSAQFSPPCWHFIPLRFKYSPKFAKYD
jgi:hypothetical protein